MFIPPVTSATSGATFRTYSWSDANWGFSTLSDNPNYHVRVHGYGQGGSQRQFQVLNAANFNDVVFSVDFDGTAIKHSGNITSDAMQRPVARWGASSASTGMIAIALPGDTGDYDMTTIEIEVYEYNSNAGSKIRVSGHTYNSSVGWHNYSVSVDGVFNKSIYLGKSSSKYYILLGDTNSSWNYGSVIVRANTEAEYYNNVTPWGNAWGITQVTTDPTSIKTSNLNTTSSRTSYTYGYSESGGSFRAPIFYDSNNTGYYTDPSSASKIVALKLEPGSVNNASGSDNVIWVYRENNNDWGIQVDADQGSATDYGFEFFGGSSHSYAYSAVAAGTRYFTVGSSYSQHDGSFRAPIFYDSNNTGYYLDPESTSVLRHVNFNNSGITAWYRGSGNAHQRADGRLDSTDAARLHWYGKTDSGTNTGFRHAWYDGAEYVHVTAQSDFVYFDRVSGTVSVQSDGSFRAPIFYDSDNTARYVNPASTSYMQGIHMNNSNLTNVNQIIINDPGVNEGITWASGNGWQIYESPDNMTNASGNLQFTTGTTFRFRVDTSGNSFSSSSSRAPIFYDSNDTGYYLDPNGTSNLGSNTIFNVGSRAVSDTSSLVRFNGNYTDGRYTHRFRKQDLSGGIPLFVDYAHSTANSYTALARFGYYTGNGYEFEVFGDSHSTTSSRAPIFYDSNNTAYYVDPASSSKLYQLSMFGHSLNTGQVMLVPDKTSYSSGAGFVNMTYRKLNSSLTYIPETVVSFQWNTTQKGSISMNAFSTQFNTSSDYRLKENAVLLTDGIQRVKQLQPKRFNFIGFADQTLDGFLAHEVSDIVPEAVTGEKDAVDENNDPLHQVIDQSKIVPLLTAALKEAISKIEDLEARIQILENQ